MAAPIIIRNRRRAAAIPALALIVNPFVPVIFWQIKVKMHSTCFFDFRKENFKYTDLLHYYYMVVLNDK